MTALGITPTPCVICRRPVGDMPAPLFSGLNQGQVFEYLCDLFGMPWIKKQSFCFVENSEFCQVCSIEIQNAMTTEESIKLLRSRLDRARGQLEGSIKSNYSAGALRDCKQQRLSRSERLGRLLLQCWSNCKVTLTDIQGKNGLLAEEEIEVIDVDPLSPAAISDSNSSSNFSNEDDPLWTPEDSMIKPEVNQKTPPAALYQLYYVVPVASSDTTPSSQNIQGTTDDSNSGNVTTISSRQVAEKVRYVGTPGNQGRKKTADSFSKARKHSCKYCDQTFARIVDMTAHLQQHIAHNKSSCKYCGLNFKTSCLVPPDNSSQSSPVWKCNLPDCERTFEKLIDLKDHHRRKCSAKISMSEQNPRPELPCNFCEKVYIRQHDLTAHLRREHPEEQSVNPVCRCGLDFKAVCFKDNVFKCDFQGCNETFRTLSDLRSHHRSKCEKYKSNEPRKRFRSNVPKAKVQAEPNRPRIRKPEPEKRQRKPRTRIRERLVCDHCGVSYSSRVFLQSHIDTVHKKTFQFICDVCGTGFNMKYRLDNHIRYVHVREKKYKCDQCDKSFIVPHQLMYHRRRHTGNPTQICELCGKAFYTLAALNAHRNGFHSEQPATCHLCGKTYQSKVHVQAHITRTHKQRWRVWVAARKARDQAKLAAAEGQGPASTPPPTVPDTTEPVLPGQEIPLLPVAEELYDY